MPAPHPVPRQQPLPLGTPVLERGWRIVLHNDDVTPFEVVILGLQKACGLSEEVAGMVAMEAHESGSAVAKRGLGQDEAEAMAGRLTALTRIPRLCPGVGCAAEEDL